MFSVYDCNVKIDSLFQDSVAFDMFRDLQYCIERTPAPAAHDRFGNHPLSF